MSKKIISIIVLVIGAFTVGWFVAKNDSQPTLERPAPALQEVVVPTARPTEALFDNSVFRNEYNEGCIGEDASREYCDCTYTYLESQMGVEGILRLALEYAETEELSREMVDAYMHCVNYLE